MARSSFGAASPDHNGGHADAEQSHGTGLGHGDGDKAVKVPIGIGVEPGDIARVVDPRDLGDLPLRYWNIAFGSSKKVYDLVIGVIEVAVLAGGRVTVVAHRDSLIVDPEDLGEDEGGTGFTRDFGNGRVDDRGSRS